MSAEEPTKSSPEALPLDVSNLTSGVAASAKGTRRRRAGTESTPVAEGQLETVSMDVRATWSGQEDRKELFLPVSGFVWLFPEEMAVVNHPAFQRLGSIYQLGQAYLVYRGATHKRLEHSLGALHVAQRMIEAIAHNSRKKGDRPATSALSDHEERFVRLGALLHDIGHMAAGHTIEDELNLASRHDEDHRLDLVLGTTTSAGEAQLGRDDTRPDSTSPLVFSRDRHGRTLADIVNDQFAKYMPDQLRLKGISPAEIVRLLIRKAPAPNRPDSHEGTQRILEESTEIRLQPCRDIIGNTICADILDYLHRDWYHVGKPRPFDERLLQYMEIRSLGTDQTVPSPADRFVISLGKRPNLRTDAISNILELLDWRYQLCESVLFHRTKLAAAAMLDRALFELWGTSHENIESILLPLSDEELLSACRKIAEERSGHGSKGSSSRAKVAEKLLAGLQRRELFTQLSTRFYIDLPNDVSNDVKSLYAGSEGDSTSGAAQRNRALRVLESDFGLAHGSLAMYCPRSVNAKIAEVQIANGNQIMPFNKLESETTRGLAGGHLDAQSDRFKRLWRVHFFIDRDVKERLGNSVFLLTRAIEKLVLNDFVDGESHETVAQTLAAAMIQEPTSPWAGGTLREPVLAAQNAPGFVSGTYPTGGTSIRAFIEAPNRR